MKNKIMNNIRFLMVIFALCGMTYGIFFPVNSVRRVEALENLSNSETVAVADGLTPQPTLEQVNEKLANTSVYFEENRGQQDKRVKYFSRGSGTQMFLTATEAVYVLRSPKSEVQSPKSEIEDKVRDEIPNPKSEIPNPQSATAVYMRLAGANEEANFAPSQELEHRTNYFKGAESEWRTEIPNYRRITAENIYDGIDMVWHGKELGKIQYDFVVAPNVDPSVITWEIEGANNVSLDAEGGLVIETEAGVMKQSKPFTFQETEGVKSEVASGFVLSEKTESSSGETSRIFKVKFALGDYDTSKTLTIDPLAYSTFLGSTSFDRGNAIFADGSGNVYLAGGTTSTAFPTTAGDFDTTHNGNNDVFVTKLNPSGSTLLYSTFIGGSSGDTAYGITVDSGNVYVTGATSSTSYPTTAGAFSTTLTGTQDDVFVTKLNSTGSTLLYSTFIGGNNVDDGRGIEVDSSGNAFVTGYTSDGSITDYPTTAGAFDTTYNGGQNDIFVTKLNASGSSLIYSTFIGGSAIDRGNAIALDLSGNAFVTGQTYDGATDYPTTGGDTTHNGDSDVFVTKLNSSGSSLVYSTFIGGSGFDEGNGIALNSSGNAFVTGSTANHITDYPTTVGAYNNTHNGGVDAFVGKLSVSGSFLFYSTFIGGSDSDYSNSIAVDSTDNAVVTGYTSSSGYPTTAGASDSTYNGMQDIFVTKLNSSGSSLVYSTFIGSSGFDISNAIAVNSSGNAFVTGFTEGFSYPTTTGVFDTTFNGGTEDAFVTKLDLVAPTAANVSISGRVFSPYNRGLSNATVTLTDQNGQIYTTRTSSFGYFRFNEIEAGQTVVVGVRSKRFQFDSQVVAVNEQLEGLNFVPVRENK